MIRMRAVSEAFVYIVALMAMARLLFPWSNSSQDFPRRPALFGQLVVGIFADVTVLALGIFAVLLVCVGQ
jgi:hypothetical protein